MVEIIERNTQRILNKKDVSVFFKVDTELYE